MAKGKKSALVEAEAEETPVAPVEAETGVAEEKKEIITPKVARPVEAVGNADVAGFEYLKAEEYKLLTEAQQQAYYARKSKHELINGPKTMFMVPLADGEKSGAMETASINGYRINIKKGTMVEIPVAFAQIIAEKYKVEMEAGSHMLLDRDEETISALS